MAFDYKKEYKEFYLPPKTPGIVEVPEMNYVVLPLEGLWWQQGHDGIDYSRKDTFEWISMIRLPEFVTEEVFQWAVRSFYPADGYGGIKICRK